jgi:hypothetical protein
MSEPDSFPINSALRNAVWVYDALVPSRFANAPAIVERRRAHELPDFGQLPEGADVAVELYGGAVTLRLDGVRRRVYTAKFDYISYPQDEEARSAFLTLWREIAGLESVAEVEATATEWLRQQTGST